MNALLDLECVTEDHRAEVLLHPLRRRILGLAQRPASATEIGVRLGLPRQKVNYHVRELARARFLRRAGERRKRNMIERRYVATARAYVLSPQVLGPLAADGHKVRDILSAAYLLALASQMQSELARAAEEARAQGKRLSTLSLTAELRFTSAGQRQKFTEALQKAWVDVVGRHASPYRRPDGRPAAGRPFRLTLGCYPIPPESEKKDFPEEG